MERKPLDSPKKARRNPPAFSNSLSTVFLRSCSRLTLFWVDGAENQLINFRLHLDDVVRLNVAPQQFFSQRILQKPLNRPTHRARAIDGIVAFLAKYLACNWIQPNVNRLVSHSHNTFADLETAH